MNIQNLLLSLINNHPDVFTAVVSFIVLGGINGLLPTKVNGPIVLRVISVLVDRLAPLTRKDARNTLKLPVFSASVLRDVADAIDPPKDPPSPPSIITGMMPMLALVVLFASPLSCTPSPRPDGTYQPSGTIAVVDGVTRILGVLSPALRPLILSQIPTTDVDARRGVDYALTGFEAASASWLAGRATWDMRTNGGYCSAYATTGAVTSSLAELIRRLAAVGVGLNPELNDLVNAGGLLADRIAYCDPVFDAAVPADADVDAQAVLRSRSVAADLRALVEQTVSEARERGRPLTPLPSIPAAR